MSGSQSARSERFGNRKVRTDRRAVRDALDRFAVRSASGPYHYAFIFNFLREFFAYATCNLSRQL